MSEQRPSPPPAVVGPGSPGAHLDTTPVSLAIDPAADERIATFVGWHLESFLGVTGGLQPELQSLAARIAIERLMPLLSSDNADRLLRQLAKRVIETRDVKDSQSK